MQKKIIAKILVLLIIGLNITLFYPAVDVQAYSNINFKDITIEDGLAQATVERIYQDSRGYIWIGTYDGLNRYDGKDFKVYRYEEDSQNSIASNTIIAIEEDNNGYLWVGTANGLSKINLNDDSVTNYYNKSEEGNLSHYNICDILIAADGTVLVATADGLNIYNKEKDSFERILYNPDKDILTNQVIYSLDQDELGNIWIGTEDGINKIDAKSKSINHIQIDEDANVEANVYRVYSDKEGFMWIGTFDSGLLKVNIHTNEITSYKSVINNESKLPGNMVKDILRDSRGDVWVCTDKGLAKYNEENDNFIVYKNKIYDRYSIVDDNIHSIIEDKSGLIWVGTYSGISTFDPNNKIEHYKYDPFIANSLSNNSIRGIYEDNENLLWIGTDTAGVNIVNRKSEEVVHISTQNTSLSSDKINYITGDEENIWVATDDGLNKINIKTNAIEIINIDDGLRNNNISTLFIDDNENLWIGTVDGINILSLKEGSIIDITPELMDSGMIDTYINAIYQDSEGIYWLGSVLDGGLTKIDPSKNLITNYKKDSEKNKSISSNAISSIVEDENKNIWIGTEYGLNKFDKKSESFTRYTEQDGLANNNIYGILLDDDNNPWVSTNYGISKLNISENKFINFNVTDGFQSNEFSGNSYFQNNTGEFFFGGINGLNIFKPNEVVQSEHVPKIIFDEFEVKGKKYNNIDGLEFDWDKNMIKFKIFLPDYKYTDKIQYYYQLIGIDEDWIKIDGNEFIYNNIAPGKYTLKIKARNHNGIMSEEQEVSFKIKAPFWRSAEAVCLYLLGIIMLIYLNNNKMKRLDKIVEKRTEQLTEEMNKSRQLLNKVINLERNKNNYFINLSHELRTPLNVICSTEQLICELNKSEDGIEQKRLNHYMDVIKRNSNRLLKLINNIIDTKKIESGRYIINVDSQDIVYLVEETALGLKDYIESKGIELIIDPEVEEKIIQCDKYEIERCIVNLVSNAAKFTQSGGRIEVVLKDLDEKIMISVEDNGIGIDKKNHDSIFDRFNQVIDENSEVKGGSGLGLTITKHIIELHSGEIYLESEVGKGSKFTIILPTSSKKDDK